MATTDLLTIDEARNAIMATDQRNDQQLAVLVSAVSQRIDKICGPVVNRSVTEYHDGGTCEILPRSRPVYSITSLIEYRFATATTLTAETVGTAPTDAYLLRPDGTIMRRNGGWEWKFWPGHGNIVLTYTAGRTATTAAVPENFKQAAQIIVAHIWRNENGSGNQTFGADGETNFRASYSIPNRAMELLGGETRGWGIA